MTSPTDSHGTPSGLGPPLRRRTEQTLMKLQQFFVLRTAEDRLLTVGLDGLTFGTALLITAFLYFVANIYLCWQIDRTYARYAPAGLSAAASPEAAREIAVQRLQWADENLAADAWFEKQFTQPALPAHEQLEGMLSGIIKTSPSENRHDDYAGLLRSYVTGRRHGWPMFVVSARPTTGREVVLALADAQNAALRRQLAADDLGLEKQTLLVNVADDLVSAVNGRLRNLERINGLLQWLTVLLAVTILCALARRKHLIMRIERGWRSRPGDVARRDSGAANTPNGNAPNDDTLGANPLNGDPLTGNSAELEEMVDRLQRNSGDRATDFERTRLFQEEMNGLRQGVEQGVYSTLGFLINLLPSLGFIGTVWGMGAALLQADELMIAVDRQEAIKAMTMRLGYAFDTTLVALGAAMAVGIALVVIRAHERRFLTLVESDLRKRFLEGDAV